MSEDGRTPVAGAVMGCGAPDDSYLLTDIVRGVLRRAGGRGWAMRHRGSRCELDPPGVPGRAQGWQLHLSATQLSAPVVLARSAAVLVRERCRFTFARNLAALSGPGERGGGVMFITVCPTDDDQLRRLAADLDAATDGLPGPVIRPARRLRPGSLVHYRYGAFRGGTVLTDAGSFGPRLRAPDGSWVAEERHDLAGAPSWATPPFPMSGQAAPGWQADELAGALLGGRFAVSRAIRRSDRGDVFHAVDRQTGAEVVLKQARAHVMAGLTGTDARDLVRHEAQILGRLAPLGLAPSAVALVPHEEDLFLAVAMVPGVTLRQFVAERAVGAWRGKGAPPAVATDLAGQLAEIVAGVHDQGLVLRGLSPDSVMVTPEGRLRLTGLAHAAPAGSRAHAVQVCGYTAPEVVTGGFGPVPSQRSDLFSLGAAILFLASGVDPVFAPDDPAQRALSVRLAALIGRLADHMPAVQRLAPLLLGLLRDYPELRWSPRRAREFLRAPDGKAAALARPGQELPDAVADRLLADGFGYLLREMTPLESRLWPTLASDQTDPCNVQFGAAGVLSVVTRAARVLGGPRLREGAAAAAEWIGGRRFDVPRLLPGLYFGRSGTAWSLYDAACLLGDDALAAHAIELAKALPVPWLSPDICHGTAGAGLALLHLSRATGDSELRQRAVLAADSLLVAAEEHDGQVCWPIPGGFDSSLAGAAHYGFGHGVAGVGAFLLYTSLATGHEVYLDTARRAGVTLEAVAETDGDAAWWPASRGGSVAGAARARDWCSGSAGVGTFLIRLWAVTGEQRFRDLAEAAAAAVYRDRWHCGTGACHGLSGHGEFLLDAAAFTGDQRYLGWARELASVMYTRHAIRDGLVVMPDQTHVNVTAGYGAGLSGFLGFLLRARHGGSRLWLPDELLSDAEDARSGQPVRTAG